ncbi:hypothetical protein GCM10010195_67340 [Kitasatospora griseola]|nr:hypothetical protein GCM10010195_67340 [Kitasatospora griseola]
MGLGSTGSGGVGRDGEQHGGRGGGQDEGESGTDAHGAALHGRDGRTTPKSTPAAGAWLRPAAARHPHEVQDRNPATLSGLPDQDRPGARLRPRAAPRQGCAGASGPQVGRALLLAAPPAARPGAVWLGPGRETW